MRCNMQNHHFDLRTGESIRLGEYKVTLLEVDNDGNAVFEIEGPDGVSVRQPLNLTQSRQEKALSTVA